MKPQLILLILSILFYGCAENSNKAPEAYNKSLLKSIDSLAQSYAANGFSGEILVAGKNGLIIHKGYGKNKNAGDTTTAFWIASTTKFFTAVCILHLQEEGKLSENDSIKKYFPGLPADKIQITIRHLLEQTSGLSSTFIAEGIVNRDSAAAEILKQGLLSQPGKHFNYANDNYILLAAIIEKVSGNTWENYVKEVILIPSGMNHTGFWGNEGEPGIKIDDMNDSIRYQPFYKKIFLNNKTFTNWGQKGASGIFSTSSDIYKMILAINAGKIFNENSRNLLFSPGFIVYSENDTIISYGHGCSILEVGGKVVETRLRGHGDWLHNNQVSILSNGYTVITWSKDYGPNHSILGYDLCKEIVALINKFK